MSVWVTEQDKCGPLVPAMLPSLRCTQRVLPRVYACSYQVDCSVNSSHVEHKGTSFCTFASRNEEKEMLGVSMLHSCCCFGLYHSSHG